jgi:Fe-S-cluster containining protein
MLPHMRARTRVWRSDGTRPPEVAGSLDDAQRRLLNLLDRDFAAARKRAGEWLVCRPGCADCCFGPVPVTRLDVRLLRRGMGELEREDPNRAERVRRRATIAVEQLAGDFPGDPSSGRLSPDENALDPFLARHRNQPCPALETASGRCEVYPWRPVACRTYGPPLRFGQEESAPCPKCFQGASAEEVERSRIEPDRGGLEQALLDRVGRLPGEPWRTLIAHALLEDK